MHSDGESSSGTSCLNLEPDCSCYEVTGLLAEHPVTISLVASNAVGSGPEASEDLYTTAPLVPDTASVCLCLKEEKTSWDTLTVGWNPAVPRGADVLEYNLTLTGPDQQPLAVVKVDGDASCEASFSPVRPCIPYQVSLVASNRAGDSEPIVS